MDFNTLNPRPRLDNRMGDNAIVLSKDYLKAGLKKHELIEKLGKVWDFLKTIAQDDTKPKGLQQNIAPQLMNDRLVKNSDKEVRVLVTCCLLEILRIWAPESPYSEDEMLTICELFISQLQSIATAEIDTELFHKLSSILSCVSVYKICVLPQLYAEAAPNLTLQMFEALFNSIRTEHPKESKLCHIISFNG